MEVNTMTNVNSIRTAINSTHARSAWNNGVRAYAMELLEDLENGIKDGWINADIFESPRLLDHAMLNGASDWKEYSWGGCSLIYDTDIALRLCNPSELKRTHNGQINPNSHEQWLDTQARALYQAATLIRVTAENLNN